MLIKSNFHIKLQVKNCIFVHLMSLNHSTIKFDILVNKEMQFKYTEKILKSSNKTKKKRDEFNNFL